METPFPDDETLLRACKVEPSWEAVWLAEEFKNCGDRLFGAIVRWVWIFGTKRNEQAKDINVQKIFSIGFDEESVKFSLTTAVKKMKRNLVSDLREADLVFINFPNWSSEKKYLQNCEKVKEPIEERCHLYL